MESIKGQISKNLFLVIIIFLFGLNIGRTQTIFSDDFESYGIGTVAAPWVTYNAANAASNSVNVWEIRNTACSITNKSLQITNGLDCQYTVNDNAAKVVYRQVSTTGKFSPTISFNWRCVGEASWDYLEVVWSTNGTAWTVAGGPYVASNAVNSASVTLPAGAENQATLYVGFRWTNDNTGGANPSAVVDNVVFTVSPYCSAAGTNTANAEQIGNVTFNTLNNSHTVCSSYNFFSNTTVVAPGSSYNLSVSAINGCGGAFTNYVKVYIDLNRNN
jgi:hypothetical protein